MDLIKRLAALGSVRSLPQKQIMRASAQRLREASERLIAAEASPALDMALTRLEELLRQVGKGK